MKQINFQSSDQSGRVHLKPARLQTLQVAAAAIASLFLGAPLLATACFAACLQLLIAFRRTHGSDEVRLGLLTVALTSAAYLLQSFVLLPQLTGFRLAADLTLYGATVFCGLHYVIAAYIACSTSTVPRPSPQAVLVGTTEAGLAREEAGQGGSCGATKQGSAE